MNNIGKQKIADAIIEDFKAKLLSGELKEGDKLPNLTDYARQLGISRLSLREALQTMEKMGAVSSRPKIGTVILCGDSTKWAYPIMPSMLNDDKTLFQLFETRMFVEGIIAEKCATNITPGNIIKMRRILDRQQAEYDANDLDAFYDCDTQFHTFIAANCNNAIIYRMYIELMQATNPTLTETLRKLPGAVSDSIYMHNKIFDAIKNSDTKSSERYAREHILRLQNLFYTENAI